MPWNLSQEYPNEIDLLPESHFYRPCYYELDKLWNEFPSDYTYLEEFELSYAPHYYGTISRKDGHIGRMTPSTVLNENRAIHQILRPLLPHPYFSIVVNCTSNDSVKRTIQSIVTQSFPLWEIMLIESSSDRQCFDYVRTIIIPNTPKFQKELLQSIRLVDSNINDNNVNDPFRNSKNYY